MTSPSEPRLFGQPTSASHHQMNEFTLSRPRDFIFALAKERDSSVGCRLFVNPQTSTIPGANPSTALRDPSCSETQAYNNTYNPGHTFTDRSVDCSASRHHFSAQPEDQSTGLCCSGTNSPLISSMTLDCRVTEFSDRCPPTGRGEALNPDTDQTNKKEG